MPGGLGYRTRAARTASGRGTQAALAAAAAAVVAEALFGSANPLETSAGETVHEPPGLVGGVAALAAAAADALPSPRAGLSGAARAASAFLRAGGPQGLLLGALLSYAAYYLANRGDGGSRHHPGFDLVNNCSGQGPSARLQEGSPWPCLSLIATGGFEVGLDAPYSVGERLTGFTEIWLCAPFVGRWCSTATYRPGALGVPAGAEPVVLPEDDPFSPYRDDGRRDYGSRERDKAIAAGAMPRQTAKDARDTEDVDQKAIVPAEVDPMALPLGWMSPRPIILPWRVVAARNDAGQRGRVQPETWFATYGGKEAEGSKVPAVPYPNAVVPGVVVTPEGRTIEPTRPLVKAGARVHERKVKPSPVTGFSIFPAVVHKGRIVMDEVTFMSLFGFVTEFGDLIDAMYMALPKDVRKEDWFANGKHRLSRANKLESLYDNYQQIDLSLMARNIVFQQLQDALIGQASRGITEATGGSPLARTIGLLGG